MSKSLLKINNIEVVYNHVILALRGVTLDVKEGSIVSLLGANGSGKTTTLKACSNLVHAERGAVTKGSIEYNGKNIAGIDPYNLVKDGVVQVLEGRHCFTNLTVEENIMTGSFIREDPKQAKQDLERVYDHFERIRIRKKSLAGFISGGEQQMVAMGRALMSRPKLILLDEPSMGLAPQLVEEIFAIVKNLNKEGVSFLVAEQNAMVALKYADDGYLIENGRVILKGKAKDLQERPDVREMYLGVGEEGQTSFRDIKYYHRRKPAFT
jgi:branched-chain amino acid transport system ATP-binding protein